MNLPQVEKEKNYKNEKTKRKQLQVFFAKRNRFLNQGAG